MKRILSMTAFAWLLPAMALAADGAAPGAGGAGAVFFAVSVATAGVGLAIAAFGGALGQGNLAGRAMEAISRQPEASGKIQTAMILGLAFVESLVIYVTLISFILLFLNPFAKHFAG